MRKYTIMLGILISFVESGYAQKKILIDSNDRDVIVLAASPEDKRLLINFLNNEKISYEDSLKIKEILGKMLLEAEQSNPMMTIQNK